MRALAWCAAIVLAVGLDASCDCDPSKPNAKCKCPEVRPVRSLGYGPLNWHIPEFRHVMTTTPVPLPPAADILGVYYLPAEEIRSNEKRSYVIRPKSYSDHIQLENPYPDSIVSPSEVHFRDVHNNKNSFLNQMHPDSTYSASYPTSAIVQPSPSEEEFRDTQSPKHYFRQVKPEYAFSSSYPVISEPNLWNTKFGDSQNPKGCNLDQIQSEYSQQTLTNGKFGDAQNAKVNCLGQLQPQYTFSSSYPTSLVAQSSLGNGEFLHHKNAKDYLLDQIQADYTSGAYPYPTIAQSSLSQKKLIENQSPKNYFLEKLQPKHTFRSSYPDITANPSKFALSDGDKAKDYIMAQTQPQFLNPYLGADYVNIQSVPSHISFKENQNERNYWLNQLQPEYSTPYHGFGPESVQPGPSQAQLRDEQNQKNNFLDQTQLGHVIPYPDDAHALPQIDLNQGIFGDDWNKKICSDKIHLKDIIPCPSVYDDIPQSGPSQNLFRSDQSLKTATFNQKPTNYVPYRSFSENPDYFLDQIQSKGVYRMTYPEIPTNVSQLSLGRREFRDSLENARSYLDLSFDGVPSQFRASEPDIEAVKNTLMNCMDLQLLLLMNTSKGDDVNKSFWNKTYTQGIVNEHQLRRQIQLKCQDPEKTFEDSVQDIRNVIINKTLRENETDLQNFNKTLKESERGSQNKTLKTNDRDSKNLNNTLKTNESGKQNFTVTTTDDSKKTVMSNSKPVVESVLSEEMDPTPTKKVKHFIDYENLSPKSEESEDNSNYYDIVTEIVVNPNIPDQTTKRPSIDPIFDITLTPLARRKRTRRGDQELNPADYKDSSESYVKVTSGYEQGRAGDSLSERNQKLSYRKNISAPKRGKRPMYKQSELKIPTVEIHELASGKIVVRKGVEKIPNSDVFPRDLAAKKAIAPPTIKTEDGYKSTNIEKKSNKFIEPIVSEHIIKTTELPALQIVKLNKDGSSTLIAKLPSALVESYKKNENSKQSNTKNDALLNNKKRVYGKLVFVGGGTAEIPLRVDRARNGTVELGVTEADRRSLCERLASRFSKNSAFMNALCKKIDSDSTVS